MSAYEELRDKGYEDKGYEARTNNHSMGAGQLVAAQSATGRRKATTGPEAETAAEAEALEVPSAALAPASLARAREVEAGP